jgi:hypothetical protein
MEEAVTPLVSESAAAARLGVNLATLRHWRRRGCGPPHIRLGERVGNLPRGTVRYRVSDLEAFIESRTVSGRNGPAT